MIRQIRTELRKQRTTGAAAALAVAAVVIDVVVAATVLGGAGRQGNPPLGPDSLAQVIAGPARALALICVLVGTLSVTGEYRHRTITTTFLAVPRRGRVVLAKVAGSALTGASIGMGCVAASLGVAVPWLRSAGVDVPAGSQEVRVAAGLVASLALYGALGAAVGALVRHQTAAAAGALAWLLAGEEVLAAVLAPAAFVHWLPVHAGAALVAPPGTAGSSFWAAATALAGTVAALGVAGAQLMRRRDVT